MVKKEGLMRGSAAWNSCQSRFYQQYQLKSGLTKARKQEDKGVQGVLPFLNITFPCRPGYIDTFCIRRGIPLRGFFKDRGTLSVFEKPCILKPCNTRQLTLPQDKSILGIKQGRRTS